jgi:hypothetical protein
MVFYLIQEKELTYTQDLAFGIRNNTFSEIINPTIVDLGPEGGVFFGLDAYKNIEGTKLAANFVLGIKLMFRLND